MTRKPAETFPLWDYVLEELDERGQHVEDLAYCCHKPVDALVDLLRSSRIDCVICEDLASFFGTSFDLWRNMAIAHSGVDPCGV